MPRILIVLLVLGWLLLIGVFAEISPLQSPWPVQSSLMQGSSFAAMRGGQVDVDELAIMTPDENGGALLIRSVDLDDAAQWPVLRYEFEGLAPTLELNLVYRRADSPQDVRTLVLTRPRGSTGTIDLSREKDWQGRISEIGFAIYPVAQSVPLEQGFKPFRLIKAEFWSPSWQGRLAAVATEWSGRRAWSLMSISALGPDNGVVRARSPALLLAFGLVFTLLLLTQFLPQSRRRTLQVMLASVVLAWLLLDLRWLRSLFDRHAATRQVYAGVNWQERQQRQPDAELLAAAQAVREAIRADGGDPDRARVLIDSASDFLRARLVYHLAPANTGPVNITGYGPDWPLSMNFYLVYFDMEQPPYSIEKQALEFNDDAVVPARELIGQPPLRLYRLGQGATQ